MCLQCLAFSYPAISCVLSIGYANELNLKLKSYRTKISNINSFSIMIRCTNYYSVYKPKHPIIWELSINSQKDSLRGAKLLQSAWPGIIYPERVLEHQCSILLYWFWYHVSVDSIIFVINTCEGEIILASSFACPS